MGMDTVVKFNNCTQSCKWESLLKCARKYNTVQYVSYTGWGTVAMYKCYEHLRKFSLKLKSN
jgi:hypothetical protein